MFQYSSERITTGIDKVDAFESIKTFDVTQNSDIDQVESYGDNNKFKTEGNSILFNESNPFGDV